MGLLASGAVRVGLVAGLFAAVGCDIEVGSGAYFCGPEMFCPSDLECNPNTFTCEQPGTSAAFVCPADSDVEPNDEPDRARAFGAVSCNISIDPLQGCIQDGADVDLIEIDYPACEGADPHLELGLWFPVATVPLELTLVDEAGAVLASGVSCTPKQNYSGMERVCLDDARPEPGTYYIRVRALDAGDCDGACRFNQYLLYIRHPLS